MITEYKTKAIAAVKTKAKPLDREMIEAMQEKAKAKEKRETWRDFPPADAACVTKKR